MKRAEARTRVELNDCRVDGDVDDDVWVCWHGAACSSRDVLLTFRPSTSTIMPESVMPQSTPFHFTLIPCL